MSTNGSPRVRTSTLKCTVKTLTNTALSVLYYLTLTSNKLTIIPILSKFRSNLVTTYKYVMNSRHFMTDLTCPLSL